MLNLPAQPTKSDARAVLFVPGRIEFLGKHTDYCGGRSLLCAVEQGFTFNVAPRNDSLIAITNSATGERVEFSIETDSISPVNHWSNYFITTARRVARNFGGELRGVDVAFESNLPPAAGLSSSSALVVGMFLILARINRLDQHPRYQSAIASQEDLAGYLGCVENGQTFQHGSTVLAGDRGVGTLGGSQDHTAILCSSAGQLEQYGFFPVCHEASIPLPRDYTFVIATSGIAAEKAGAAQLAYNRNPLIVRRILDLWNRSTGRCDACLAAAVRSDASAPDRLRRIIQSAPTSEFSAGTLLDRLEQFIEESERIIPAAADALRRGDLVQLGEFVDHSQKWAQRGLGNQLPQTMFLTQSARDIGAAAASAFGAGFGGSVWALISKADADAFQIEWLERYGTAFPSDAARAQTFITSAAPPARWRNE
jgi:galactokinase